MPYNDNLQYWTQRYDNMTGEKVVGNMIWTEEEYKKQLDIWIEKINPFLLQIEPVQKLLDFGVGIGRWFPHLSKCCTVDDYYGCDIVNKMPKKSRIQFGLIDNNHNIPFNNIKFDLIWTCVVLQHVVDDDLLKYYAKQFYNRLYNYGHLLIVENVSEHKDRNYLKFRTESDYINLFENIGFEFINKDYIIDSTATHMIALFRKGENKQHAS